MRRLRTLPRLLAVAPLALVGSFIAGLLVNGFFTMASVFLLQQGFSLRQIAFYLMIAMITGFAVQLPIARFSDRYGRRRAILVCAILAAAGALTGLVLMMAGIEGAWPHYVVAALFGLGLFALYALSVARVSDNGFWYVISDKIRKWLLTSSSFLGPHRVGADDKLRNVYLVPLIHIAGLQQSKLSMLRYHPSLNCFCCRSTRGSAFVRRQRLS